MTVSRTNTAAIVASMTAANRSGCAIDSCRANVSTGTPSEKDRTPNVDSTSNTLAGSRLSVVRVKW